MDEILHHLGALNYCNPWDFKDFRWCKISSINSMGDFLGEYYRGLSRGILGV